MILRNTLVILLLVTTQYSFGKILSSHFTFERAMELYEESLSGTQLGFHSLQVKPGQNAIGKIQVYFRWREYKEKYAKKMYWENYMLTNGIDPLAARPKGMKKSVLKQIASKDLLAMYPHPCSGLIFHRENKDLPKGIFDKEMIENPSVDHEQCKEAIQKWIDEEMGLVPVTFAPSLKSNKYQFIVSDKHHRIGLLKVLQKALNSLDKTREKTLFKFSISIDGPPKSIGNWFIGFYKRHAEIFAKGKVLPSAHVREQIREHMYIDTKTENLVYPSLKVLIERDPDFDFHMSEFDPKIIYQSLAKSFKEKHIKDSNMRSLIGILFRYQWKFKGSWFYDFAQFHLGDLLADVDAAEIFANIGDKKYSKACRVTLPEKMDSFGRFIKKNPALIFGNKCIIEYLAYEILNRDEFRELLTTLARTSPADGETLSPKQKLLARFEDLGIESN